MTTLGAVARTTQHANPNTLPTHTRRDSNATNTCTADWTVEFVQNEFTITSVLGSSDQGGKFSDQQEQITKLVVP